MSKGKAVVCLVTRSEVVGRDILRAIKVNHDREPNVETVHSHRVYEPQGIVTLLKQNKERGFVYIFKDDFSDEAIKAATETKIPFYIISKNNGGWTSSCVNRTGGGDIAVSTPMSHVAQ